VSAAPSKRLGKQTFRFDNPVIVTHTSTVVGRKEGQGPLGKDFDLVKQDNMLGEKSFERAEAKMLEEACALALAKGHYTPDQVDILAAGDLLNQIISANYAARTLSIPFFGLYGACSTFAEGLALAAILVDGGYAGRVLTATSSHHDTAERQYRYPTEFGGQRPPTAQWTVTGAGAAIVEASGQGPRLTQATIGSVFDMGIKDPNNMGAAMAPAAASTIEAHFRDTTRTLDDYDAIVTGDLGIVGQRLLKQLLSEKGLTLGDKHWDCGIMIYDKGQDAHSGGSGCGCSACVFCGHIIKKIRSGQLRRILLVATGALHSPCVVQQGESIPGIAHAVVVEYA
jgi:stage V sporulation protein AD